MFRRFSPIWPLCPLIILALFLGACSDEVTYVEEHVFGSENLQASVGDSLLFWGSYSGNPNDVARHSWDFNSDGAWDKVWTNSIPDTLWFPYGEEWTPWSAWWDSLGTFHQFNQPGDYIATLQITTVQNQLYRWLTHVTVSDLMPEIMLVAQDSADCGEDILLMGRAMDDAGAYLSWDLDGFPGIDLSTVFLDSLEFLAYTAFDEPGRYTISFSATDNDSNKVSESHEIQVGTAPSWESGTDMGQERADHAAASWNDRIFVFGGRHGNGVLNTAEVYDPAGDSWSSISDMPTARWGLKAVTMDDLIYVIGGVTSVDTIFPQLEIYDPALDTWTTFAPDTSTVMTNPRRGFSAQRIGNTTVDGDSIFVFGGMFAGAMEDTVMVYQTAIDDWNQVSGKMQQTRAWMADGTIPSEEGLGGDFILALGGTRDGATPTDRCAVFNVLSDIWQTWPGMPTARLALCASAYDGKIYAIGGFLGASGVSDKLEVYSLAYGTWEEEEPMPFPRGGATATALGGRIYVIGGSTEGSSTYNVQASRNLQILNPWSCSP